MATSDIEFFCTKPWTSFEINDHKGVVTPCCWSKLECGNVNESSIAEIWNSPAFQHMRRHMAEGRLDLICSHSCPYRLGEHVDTGYPEPVSDVFRANHDLQQQEIRQRKTVLKSLPTVMNICPSIACNLTCVMCYQDRDDTVELPVHMHETILSHFPTLRELWILGGEPFISKECVSIIEQMDPVRFPDLHLGVITNGTVINEKVEKLLLSRRISWILVSVDAATSETFKKIRGGKFEKVIDGIKRLRHIRDVQGGGWSLRIGFTVMRSNMHEATAFAKLASDLGVGCQFSPVFGTYHSENFYSDPDLVERAKEIMLELGNVIEALGGDKIRISRVWARLTDPSKGEALQEDDLVLPFDEWKQELFSKGLLTED